MIRRLYDWTLSLAGRKTAADTIDYSAGIETLCRLGLEIVAEQPLFRIFSNDESAFDKAEQMLRTAIMIGDIPPNEDLPLVVKVLT